MTDHHLDELLSIVKKYRDNDHAPGWHCIDQLTAAIRQLRNKLRQRDARLANQEEALEKHAERIAELEAGVGLLKKPERCKHDWHYNKNFQRWQCHLCLLSRAGAHL